MNGEAPERPGVHQSRFIRAHKTAFRILVVLLALLGAVVVAVSATPLVEMLAARMSYGWNDEPSDVLVVLLGESVEVGHHDRSEPFIGQGTYWRTVYAVHLWRSGRYKRILLSGTGSESTVKPLLVSEGIPASVIEIESNSTTTRENALRAAPILKGRTATLLSSDYHMLRACRSFKAAGIAVRPHPAPDVLKRGRDPLQRWSCFLEIVVELAKLARYRALGWA